jgi:hypothetical protein
MDKVIRSQPTLLLTDPEEVLTRIKFLYGLFLEYPTGNVSGAAATDENKYTYNPARSKDLSSSEVVKTLSDKPLLNDAANASPSQFSGAGDPFLEQKRLTLPLPVPLLVALENSPSLAASAAALDKEIERKALKTLRSVIITYPAVLSIDHL